MREPAAEHGEDLELVERMLAGRQEAFEVFGERYFRALYRFTLARLGGDGDQAREVVQMAMTKALARLTTYRGEASLLTWLCSCCKNEVLMQRRRRRSAPAEVEWDEELAADERVAAPRPSDPEAGVLERESAHLVHAALDTLPPHYSRALEWKYLEHLPVKEIAGRLQVEPKAAESLLTRARGAFRKSYENLGGVFAAGARERFGHG